MPQWATQNGLIVPERVTMAKKYEQAQREQAARGRFFSSYANSMGAASYGYTKPADTLSFDLLKQARSKSLIDKIIINARIIQMKHIAKRCIVPGKQVGFRVVHENHADPNFKPTRDVTRRCKEMETILDTGVNPTIHPGGFRDFAAIAVDQELTYDRKAMVIQSDRTGAPIRYHLVDGTTVRPMLLVLLQHMDQKKITDPEKALASYRREYGFDLANAAYVQVVDGSPVATWAEDEMSIDITNPTVEINKWAYGNGSMLEQSIDATTSWLNAWSYNDGLFNQDSPESLLFLYGDYDPIGLGAFQRQVLDQSGSGDYQKIPVIPSDPGFKAELIKIRELPKDIQFAEFLRMVIQLKTAAYRAHPSIVNFSIDKGGGGGMTIGSSNEDGLIDRAHEEGFQSICHSQAQWLTKTIVKPRYPDLVVIYEVDTEDEVRRVEVINKQMEGAMTFNEARRAQGLVGDLPYGDVPNNPNYIRAMELGQQAEQQKMQSVEDEGEGAGAGADDPDLEGEVDDESDGAVQKHLAKGEKVLIIEILD